MPKVCLEALYKIGKRLLQIKGLYTFYTVVVVLINKLSIFIQKLVTVYTLKFRVSTPSFFVFLRSYFRISTHHPQHLYIQLNKGLY